MSFSALKKGKNGMGQEVESTDNIAGSQTHQEEQEWGALHLRKQRAPRGKSQLDSEIFRRKKCGSTNTSHLFSRGWECLSCAWPVGKIKL